MGDAIPSASVVTSTVSPLTDRRETRPWLSATAKSVPPIGRMPSGEPSGREVVSLVTAPALPPLAIATR